MAAHKMKDGRWCVWLDLGSDPATGKRLRKRIEARTKREAESKSTALRERHARGENIFDAPRSLKEAPATRTYHRAKTPHPRDSEHVQQLGRTTIADLPTSAQNRARSVLNFAIEQGDRTDNPAEKVRIPAVTQKPGRSLTLDEVRAVRAAYEGQRYGLAIDLALMGLRRAELPGLRWDDFDEQAGTLYVRYQIQRDRKTKRWVPIDPKRNGMRLLTLGSKLTAALRQYRWQMTEERETMGWEESGYIFTSTRNGGICPPDTIYQAYRAIIKAAGVEARLHDCRHTAGTYLLSNGEDFATVSGVLGHANPQVTASVYLHALPHKVADASKRLEDIYE